MARLSQGVPGDPRARSPYNCKRGGAAGRLGGCWAWLGIGPAFRCLRAQWKGRGGGWIIRDKPGINPAVPDKPALPALPGAAGCYLVWELIPAYLLSVIPYLPFLTFGSLLLRGPRFGGLGLLGGGVGGKTLCRKQLRDSWLAKDANNSSRRNGEGMIYCPHRQRHRNPTQTLDTK